MEARKKKYHTVIAIGFHLRLVVDKYVYTKQLRKCFAENTNPETDKPDRKLLYRKTQVEAHGGAAFIGTYIVFSAEGTTIKQREI
jgi:hypothetical protein